VAALRDHHATIFIPPDCAAAIERLRREWDPVMAAQVTAHLTLAYPGEAPATDLMRGRLAELGEFTPPFRLGIGALRCFERPENGVYVEVDDFDSAYGTLRKALLQPPFEPYGIAPHVTVIHPRTSARGREFWDLPGRPRRVDGQFTVREVTITAFDGARWVVTARLALRGR